MWTPTIKNISTKNSSFHQGEPHASSDPIGTLPEFNPTSDWYFTPAVATEPSRKKTSYGSQRVLWVDCDEGFSYDKLISLKPYYMWETSPNHYQAVWLMKESIPASEFNKDGLIGLITQVIGADKSGVDIGQLLRIPGTHHNKRTSFQGKVLTASRVKWSIRDILFKTAMAMGLPRGLASEIADPNPYGDRSKQIWKFSNSLHRAGVPEELAFKLLRASAWNKWKGDDNALREDISSAYAQPLDDLRAKHTNTIASDINLNEDNTTLEPLRLKSLGEFGSVIREPIKWVVPGIIPESGCGLIVAPPKVGKTRIAIEIAAGVASGDSPLGISVRKPLRVAFLSLEDGEYLFSMRMNVALNSKESRAQYHWDGHVNTQLEWAPPQDIPLSLVFDTLDLSSDEDKQRLADMVYDNKVDLLIIDTLSMAVGKGDINNSSDMYAILKDIKTIAKTYKCAVLFIHHTRKRVFNKGESIQERILGSTALHAWSDFLISLTPPEEGSDLMPVTVQTKMGGQSFLVDSDLHLVGNSVRKVNPS